ncbi:MAG: ASCH domain-containing protein [Anaerolineales bacterium]|nr:ASCH domain-containing protein [Anaerolineales bacterium]
MTKEIQNRALSVRQPLAEQIMRGTKKIEYRSRNTNIRGRVYIYASKKPRVDIYKKMKVEPGTFPAGVLVGTVEIVDCKEKSGEYHWILAKPKRLKKLVKPKSQPQPVWFKPFKE